MCDCNCGCKSKVGGPSSRMETCPSCKLDFMCYRGGSHDWQPKRCPSCSVADLMSPETFTMLDEEAIKWQR